MDSSNEWHNESKEGALMINEYKRDTYDYDQAIKNIGKEMIQAEEMEDDEKVKFLQSQGINIDTEEFDKLMEVGDQDSNEEY